MSDGFSKRPVTKPTNRWSLSKQLEFEEKMNQKEKEEVLKQHLTSKMKEILSIIGIKYEQGECIKITKEQLVKLLPNFNFVTGEDVFEDDDRKQSYGIRYNIREKSIFASYWHYYKHPRWGIETKANHEKIFSIDEAI